MQGSSFMSSELEAYLDAEEMDARKIEPRNLRKLCREILKYPVPFVSGVLMIFFGTFATLLESRLFGYAIDEAIVPRNSKMLYRLSIVFLLVICTRVSMLIGQSYVFEILGQRVTQSLR